MSVYQKDIIGLISELYKEILLQNKLSDYHSSLDFLSLYILVVWKDGDTLSEFLSECKDLKHNIKKRVDELVNKNFLKKVKDKEDRRKRKLYRTKSGKVLTKKLLRLYKEKLSVIFGQLTVNQEKTIIKVITKIKQNL